MDMNSLYVVRTTNEQILAEYSLPPFRRSVRGSNFIPGEITWLDGLPAIPLENLIFATSMPDYSVLLLILKGGTWNKVEPIAISFFPRGCVSLVVADPGKGPGVLGLLLIFRPNWGPTWSPLISGSGWPPPAPRPPLSEGLDPPLSCGAGGQQHVRWTRVTWPLVERGWTCRNSSYCNWNGRIIE